MVDYKEKLIIAVQDFPALYGHPYLEGPSAHKTFLCTLQTLCRTKKRYQQKAHNLSYIH